MLERAAMIQALRAYRGGLVAVALFSLIINLLMLAPSLYMEHIYDRVLASKSTFTLLFLTVIVVLMYAMVAVAEWSRTRVLARLSVVLDQRFRKNVFDTALRASWRAPNSQSASAAALADMTQLRQFVTGRGLITFLDLPWTPLYIAILFVLHPVLGWVAVVSVALLAALTVWGGRREAAPQLRSHATMAATQQFLAHKLRNAETIEALGMFGVLCWRWLQRHLLQRQAQGHEHALAHAHTAFGKFARNALQSVTLGLAAWLTMRGELSMGAMLATNLLVVRALAPVDALLASWRGMVDARAAFFRLQSLVRTHPAPVPETADANDLAWGQPVPALVLNHVSAFVTGRDAPLLRDVSLNLPAGRVAVVLGPSGAGKSTLLRVLLGIWSDIQGEVLLDGRPVSDWPRSKLGPYLGYLPQDVELLDGSIAENIARSGPVDPQRVIAAGMAAGLHQEILRFPGGYDMVVGARGNQLSGGMRQRIGLARALYGDPVLVVLDEPNASLDKAGETALLDAISGLRHRGATVVMVTHNQQLLGIADSIVIMETGQVQFHGTVDEILARKAP